MKIPKNNKNSWNFQCFKDLKQMKKIISLFIVIILLGSFVIAEDFDKEADRVLKEIEESIKDHENYQEEAKKLYEAVKELLKAGSTVAEAVKKSLEQKDKAATPSLEDMFKPVTEGGFDPDSGMPGEIPKPTVKRPDIPAQFVICQNPSGCAGVPYGGVRALKEGFKVDDLDKLKDAGFAAVNPDFYSAIQEAKGKYYITTENGLSVISFEPSEQDWSRGLNNYKTNFYTKYTINADGSISETVTETVQTKLSKKEQEEYDKDPEKQRVGEWTLANTVSQTSLIREDNKITGKVIDHFYDGAKIGSFETRISVDPKTDKITQTGTMIIDGVRYTFDSKGRLPGDRSLSDIYDDLLAGKRTPEAQKYLNDLESGFREFDSDKLFEDIITKGDMTEKQKTVFEFLHYFNNAEMTSKLTENMDAWLEDDVKNKRLTQEEADNIRNLINEKKRDLEKKEPVRNLLNNVDTILATTGTISLEALDSINNQLTQMIDSGALTDEQADKLRSALQAAAEGKPLTDEEKANLAALKGKTFTGDKLFEDFILEKQETIRNLLNNVDTILATTGTISLEALDSINNQLTQMIDSGALTDEQADKLRSALQAASEGRPLTDEEKANLATLKAGVDEDKKKQLKQSRKENIDEYIGEDFAMWEKISEMGFWRFMGTAVHAYNKYKGLGKLTALIFGDWAGWDFLKDEEIMKRKQKLQDDFCVIGGLKQCWTSLICEFFVDSQSSNYVLTTGPDRETPMLAASIVGEKSDAIRFKGETRDNLISLFGDYTYINDEKIDFTKIDFDPTQLDVLMWLYHAQLSVRNPLPDRNFSFNIEFRGNRRAKWFNDWQDIAPGKRFTKNIIKYSTTDYDKVCIIFKDEIRDFIQSHGTPWAKTLFTGVGLPLTAGIAGIVPIITSWGDVKEPFGSYKNEFCSPFVGAGPATTVDGKQTAANNQQDPDFPEGAQI